MTIHLDTASRVRYMCVLSLCIRRTHTPVVNIASAASSMLMTMMQLLSLITIVVDNYYRCYYCCWYGNWWWQGTVASGGDAVRYRRINSIRIRIRSSYTSMLLLMLLILGAAVNSRVASGGTDDDIIISSVIVVVDTFEWRWRAVKWRAAVMQSRGEWWVICGGDERRYDAWQQSTVLVLDVGFD